MTERDGIKDVKTRLPSDTEQIFTVAKYDVLKHMRSKRLLAMGVIAVLVMALATFLGTYNNIVKPSAAEFMGTYTGTVYLLVLVGVTLFAGDAIVSEFQGRTGYLLFPNPVRKSSLYLGKFLASFGIMGAVIVLYYLIAIVITALYTGGFSVLSIYSLLLALLFIAAATGVAFLISSALKTSVASLVLTFFMFLLILNMISSVGSLVGFKPDLELTFCSGTISNVMIEPYPHDKVTEISMGGGQNMTLHEYYPDIGISILVETGWLIVTAALGYVLFKRREMVS